MNHDHLYIVAYDIADPKRWRAVFKTMTGYGEWLQLSVFQCRLSPRRHIQLMAELQDLIHQQQDHIVVMDLGPADTVRPRVQSLGKSTFQPVQRTPIII